MSDARATASLPRKEPFDVRCKPCGHTWTAAYTPLPLETMGALLKGLRCPMCGKDSNTIFAEVG